MPGSTQILSINGQTFTLSGLAVVNSSGQFDLNSGTFEGDTNSGGAIFDGTLTCSGGTLSGVLTFASNAVVNLIQAFSMPVAFNTLGLTNLGTVNWVNTDLQGTSAQIFNYGLWEAQTNNTFFGGNGGTTFNNFGVLRKSGGDRDSGSTDFDSQTTFNNPGTVDCQNGLLSLDNGSGGGLFNNAANGTTFFGFFTLTGDPLFSGAGRVAGYLTGSNAMVHGIENSDYLHLFGTLTLASNNVLNLLSTYAGSFSIADGTLTNQGTVNWNSPDFSGQNARIENHSLWDVQTNNTFHGNSSTVFNNFGVLRKSGGEANSGSTYLDQNTVFNNPGTVDCRVGQLAIGGSYTLSGGALNFSISSSNNFGSLYLAGNATLTEALSVNFTNGYSPVADTSFPLVGYGSETGIFTTLSLPHLSPGLVWQTNYGSTTFTLIVTSAPPTQLSVAMTEDGGTLSLTWNAIVGQTYQLQYTTNLAPANWLNLGDTVTATNDTMTASEAIGQNPQRFYRLVLVWLP
jgi:hypothetical protein